MSSWHGQESTEASSPEPISELDFTAYIDQRRALVDRLLDAYLPAETDEPATLSRAVRYSLFAGGKRLRPLLVMAAAEALSGKTEDALPAAAAFELIHTYSLIHDDLPSMDDDSLRRGAPTSHVVFGEAIAVLAGDALQSHAFQILAAPPDSCSCSAPAALRLRAIEVLATAAGATGMVGGQVADLESESRKITPEALEYIHRHKTGALIRAATEVGAIMAGGSNDHIETFRQFGEELGLAFQIVDDILDVEGSDESLGKSAGKDAAAGKATYPSVHGMKQAKQQAVEIADSALSLVAPFGQAAAPLGKLARRVIDRRS